MDASDGDDFDAVGQRHLGARQIGTAAVCGERFAG
jgi:hypothetical protein